MNAIVISFTKSTIQQLMTKVQYRETQTQNNLESLTTECDGLVFLS